jgi:hypothetical protein
LSTGLTLVLHQFPAEFAKKSDLCRAHKVPASSWREFGSYGSIGYLQSGWGPASLRARVDLLRAKPQQAPTAGISVLPKNNT